MGEAAAAAEPVDPANGEKAMAAIKTLEGEAEAVRAFIADLSGRLKPHRHFRCQLGSGDFASPPVQAGVVAGPIFTYKNDVFPAIT